MSKYIVWQYPDTPEVIEYVKRTLRIIANYLMKFYFKIGKFYLTMKGRLLLLELLENPHFRIAIKWHVWMFWIVTRNSSIISQQRLVQRALFYISESM